jgi:muramoyltetrapeptide carboxypeptidase LdcA involved in peptidoglycan recycling
MSDTGEPDQVRNSVADLIAHGVFNETAGLVVGRPVGYDSEESRGEHLDIIKGLCEGRLAKANPCPILCNVDIGHTTSDGYSTFWRVG